jgi:hypothetical protein
VGIVDDRHQHFSGTVDAEGLLYQQAFVNLNSQANHRTRGATENKHWRR